MGRNRNLFVRVFPIIIFIIENGAAALRLLSELFYRLANSIRIFD